MKRLSQGHQLVGSKAKARTEIQTLQGLQESYMRRPSGFLCITQNCQVSLSVIKFKTVI